MKRKISRLVNFEKKIENKFLTKLKINKDDTKNPDVGDIAKTMSDGAEVTSVVLGLGVGVTLALGIGTFGIPALVGATVAGLTFIMTKVDKKMKKRNAKKIDKKLEIYFHSHLKYIIKDVAKELSRIFEYQLLALKDDTQEEILAKCAVDLMLDLKKGDKFDRNTLLRKVLQDGSIKKKKLLTRNDSKWSVPDVFRKPGLRRTNLGTDHAEFKCFVKPDHACDTQTYGYRGQFLEMKKYVGQIEAKVQFRERVSEENIDTCEDPELCQNSENCSRRKLRRMDLGTDLAEFKCVVEPDHSCDTQTYGYCGQFPEIKKYRDRIEEEEKVQVVQFRKRASVEKIHTCEDAELCQECSSYHENCGQYFVESSVDSEYSDSREELLKYDPIHVLVRCPKVLDSFIGSHQAGEISLANFLKNKLGLPKDHIVLPVYRQHSPGKVPDLKKSILTGSDFSHSDFTNCYLEECDFTKCVLLFAKLEKAKMSGSKFVDTLISHSNLVGVKADRCEWTKTSLLFSRVDGADLGSVEPSMCGNCLVGTNIYDAITGKKSVVKVNGPPV